MALDQQETALIDGVIEFDQPQILWRIFERDVAMAVWRRDPPDGLGAGLDAVAPEHLPQARFTARREAAPQVFDAACAPLPEPSLRDALAADAASLAAWFAEVMSAQSLRIRFQSVDTDVCRLFHCDSVSARLLCTYRGPATEYGLGEQGETPTEIHALRRGDVAILKGLRWPNAPAHKLLHRSPPIVGTGLTRLLLVVDAAEE